MILTRSPFYYNVVHDNNFVTQVDYELIIGTGSTSVITEIETYNFTKLKALTNNTWLDISPYIRDFYDFNPVTTTGTATSTVKTSGNNQVLIASIEARQIDSLGSTLSPTSQKYICTDGYGYYTDGQNLEPTQNILLTHDTYKADARGYFIVPLRVASGDLNPTVNGTGVALSFVDSSINYVKYLVIPCVLYSGNISVTFGGETINIELIEECKYPVKEIQFLNRFGVFETLHFYKAAKESINIESKDFKNAYTNGVSYDVQRHQMQKLNVKSNKSVNIETGFLNPNYNATMEELLQSEKVYLDGVPVNVDTNSLELKTRIVDKLISYSIDFKYAFDQISNV